MGRAGQHVGSNLGEDYRLAPVGPETAHRFWSLLPENQVRRNPSQPPSESVGAPDSAPLSEAGAPESGRPNPGRGTRIGPGRTRRNSSEPVGAPDSAPHFCLKSDLSEPVGTRRNSSGPEVAHQFRACRGVLQLSPTSAGCNTSGMLILKTRKLEAGAQPRAPTGSDGSLFREKCGAESGAPTGSDEFRRVPTGAPTDSDEFRPIPAGSTGPDSGAAGSKSGRS